MKKLSYLIGLLSISMLWTGCSKEDIDIYSGEDALYFAQQWGVAHFVNNIDVSSGSRNAHQPYSRIAFGNMAELDSMLRVNIQITGFVRDYDRPFKVEIVKDSTTAIEGTEFELVDPETDAVIRAGQTSTQIRVHCHKSDRMNDENLQLQLRIIPGEYFTLPFDKDGFGKMPIIHSGSEVLNEYHNNNYDPSIHNIFLNNFLIMPTGWIARWMGEWNEDKYALLLDMTREKLGWTILTWNDAENMWPSGGTRYALAQKILAEYLMEQYRKGREFWVLDPDGTMMWVPDQNLPWAEDARPENMENN